MNRSRAWIHFVIAWASLLFAVTAEARSALPPDDEALFQAAVARLHEGKPGEAIADFEALADHGVIVATVSFDRGLAYVSRVRAFGEQPGDLGEAAHGFLEAKTLSSDHGLSADATRSLTLVRSEVGRRRAHAGEPVEFDPGLALGPSFLRLLSEDTWALLAIVGSIALGLGLFVRRAAREQTIRLAATVSTGVATLVLIVGTLSTFAARQERLSVTPGVSVSGGVRPTSDNGIVVANAPVIPEAAEVEILERGAGRSRVRWGSVNAWVPSGSVRAVAP